MTDIAPGWYRDPVDRTVQRYWDGEGWVGDALPADATPPPGPPPAAARPASAAPKQVSPAGPRPVSPPEAGPGSPPGTGSPPVTGWPPAAGPWPQPGSPGSAPGPATGPGSPTPGPGSPAPGSPPAPGALAAPGPPTATPYAQPPPGPPRVPGWSAYPGVLVPPAPRPHGLPLASLGARLLARLIDIGAVLGLNALVNGWFVYRWWQINQPFWREFYRRFYAGESTAGLEAPAEGSTLMIIILVLAAALWFAYEVPAHANTGQTLGKRLTGIKVVRVESTQPLGIGRSIRRWNTLGLPTLLWTCGVGFLLQFLDCLWVAIDRPLHQALHDKSAATVVVHVGRSKGDTR